ncbi:MAG: hypothetical protein QNJ73_08800 [Gammaproteobacteria bacterium]|nr:hypothetical protein [Gammaproteobacteria bacterium]
MRIGKANALASLWGFAEATLFFIVPDVLVSWVALRSLKRGLIACFFALAGALIGGVAMWVWGRADPDTARAIFESLPALDATTIATVRQQLMDSGITALFLGPTGGTPYKIYAVEAADLGFGLATFLAVSIPARLARFVLVTIVVGVLSWSLRERISLRARQAIHVTCWFVFYAWFFAAMAT